MNSDCPWLAHHLIVHHRLGLPDCMLLVERMACCLCVAMAYLQCLYVLSRASSLVAWVLAFVLELAIPNTGDAISLLAHCHTVATSFLFFVAILCVISSAAMLNVGLSVKNSSTAALFLYI